MATTKSLNEALKEILKDDGKISKYEAHVLKEMILADGHISSEEKAFLERAVKENQLDDQAYQILHELLLREETKYRT